MLHPILDINDFNVGATFAGRMLIDYTQLKHERDAESLTRSLSARVRPALLENKAKMVPGGSLCVIHTCGPGVYINLSDGRSPNRSACFRDWGSSRSCYNQLGQRESMDRWCRW